MKTVKKYAFLSLIIRALLLLVGFIFYETSCPIEITPWILHAIFAFTMLEPLAILLIALLAETSEKFK